MINARITQKTHKKWKFIPKTAKYIFSTFELCLTSNKETGKFLKEFNARNIIYSGNIKLIQPDEKIKYKLNEKILVNNNGQLLAHTKMRKSSV